MESRSFKFMLVVASVVFLNASAGTSFALTAAAESTSENSSGTSSDAVTRGQLADENFDFRLVGVAVSSKSGQNRAVIEQEPDWRQRFIREGDRIGPAMVKKILNDRVVLEIGQDNRIVLLNRAYQDGDSPGGTMQSGQGDGNPQPDFSRKETVAVDGSKVSASLADIVEVMQNVNLNPINVYGRPVGVRISPIETGSFFAEIGLKTGDIITAVDGGPIKGQEAAIAFLERIRSGGEFEIFVKGSRHSRKISLIVN
jgi:type II secretion system protein C